MYLVIRHSGAGGGDALEEVPKLTEAAEEEAPPVSTAGERQEEEEAALRSRSTGQRPSLPFSAASALSHLPEQRAPHATPPNIILFVAQTAVII